MRSYLPTSHLLLTDELSCAEATWFLKNCPGMKRWTVTTTACPAKTMVPDGMTRPTHQQAAPRAALNHYTGPERKHFCPECGNLRQCTLLFPVTAAPASQPPAPSAQAALIPPSADESMPALVAYPSPACPTRRISKGRAGRPGYWWFFLFVLLLGWGASPVDCSGTLAGFHQPGLPPCRPWRRHTPPA